MIEQSLTSIIANVLPGARIEAQSLPLIPQLKLYLLNADYPQQQLDSQQIQHLMQEPAYWIFCWASGQVLARWIQSNPETVKGRTVLDFGTGSGVVAIAAAQAGARKVYASDLDPVARQACRANAGLNGLELEVCGDWRKLDADIDVILVADVLYDRQNLPLLHAFAARSPEVIVADSRIRNFSIPPYRKVAEMDSATFPDLDESDEFRRVRLFHAARRT